MVLQIVTQKKVTFKIVQSKNNPHPVPKLTFLLLQDTKIFVVCTMAGNIGLKRL